MNLLEDIDRYVERKRANGAGFDKGHANLTAFARQVGNVPLHAITTYDVAKYLDGPLTSTVTWRGKHSLLRHFLNSGLLAATLPCRSCPLPAPQSAKPLLPTSTRGQKFVR
jgi:hypothetical protein